MAISKPFPPIERAYQTVIFRANVWMFAYLGVSIWS